MNRQLRADLRTFLVSSLLMLGGLAAIEFRPPQDPPPALAEPVPSPTPTPDETGLILYLIDRRSLEIAADPHSFIEIWWKYDQILREALPPGKYLIYKTLFDGC